MTGMYDGQVLYKQHNTYNAWVPKTDSLAGSQGVKGQEGSLTDRRCAATHMTHACCAATHMTRACWPVSTAFLSSRNI